MGALKEHRNAQNKWRWGTGEITVRAPAITATVIPKVCEACSQQSHLSYPLCCDFQGCLKLPLTFWCLPRQAAVSPQYCDSQQWQQPEWLSLVHVNHILWGKVGTVSANHKSCIENLRTRRKIYFLFGCKLYIYSDIPKYSYKVDAI